MTRYMTCFYHEIETSILKKDMESLLYLRTKNVIFSFNDEIYQQTDWVGMGSPFELVIAGIFMVELENTSAPILSEYESYLSGNDMLITHFAKLSKAI